MRYLNHIEHYIIDAQEFDYFCHDPFMVQELLRRYEEIFSLTSFKPGDKVLEIGSGDGSGASKTKKFDLQYYMLDISTANLNRIKQLNIYNKIYPVTGDTYRIPFKNARLNAIIMSEVLEHLENPVDALKQVCQALKENGILILTVPYKEKIIYYLCIHCNKRTPAHAHLHSFDEKKMEEIMNTAGFKIIKISKSINKVAQRLYIYRILKFLPFRIWKFFDHLFNFLIDKPTSYIFVVKKN